MEKWLILDRDGVINYDSDQFKKSPEEWAPLPGSLEAIAARNKAGCRVAVISNQSGLARGLFSAATLDAIHEKFRRLLAEAGGRVEQIYFCPHGPDDGCSCRKPLPGLFLQFAEDFDLALDNVYAVGDSVRDLEAALSSGAHAVLVRTGKGENSERTLGQLEKGHPLRSVAIHDDLSSFVTRLLADNNPS